MPSSRPCAPRRGTSTDRLRRCSACSACQRSRSTAYSVGVPARVAASATTNRTVCRSMHHRRRDVDGVDIDDGQLVEAVGADARPVLVGDPDQLASIEAGASSGTSSAQPGMTRSRSPGALRSPSPSSYFAVSTATGGAIAELASAIRRGDVDATLAVLRGGNPDVEWIETDANADGASGVVGPVRIGSSMPDVESPTQPRPAMPPAHSMRSPVCVSGVRIVAARTGSRAGPLESSAGSPSRSRAMPPTACGTSGGRCS